MAINLSDYEAGAQFDGDYDETLAALQERLARMLVAYHRPQAARVIVVEGWDAAARAARSSG